MKLVTRFSLSSSVLYLFGNWVFAELEKEKVISVWTTHSFYEILSDRKPGYFCPILHTGKEDLK